MVREGHGIALRAACGLLPGLALAVVALLVVRAAACGNALAVAANCGDLPCIHEWPSGSSPVLDGRLLDWRRAIGAPTFTEADFTLDTDLPSLQDGELSAQHIDLYLAWQSTPPRIYAAFSVTDNFYAVDWEGDLPAFGEDYIGIGVDGDASGGVLSGGALDPYSIEKFYRQAQRYFIYPSDAKSMFGWFPADSSRWDWLLGSPWFDVGGFLEPNEQGEAVVEVMVTPFDHLSHLGPAESVPSSLAAGSVIGIEAVYMDYDAEIPDSNMSLQLDSRKIFHLSQDLTSNRTDDWPKAVLLSGAPTGIQLESWGGIKDR